MTFGYIVLYGWPLVVAILFRVYSRHVAFLVAIIAGYLLLPTQLSFDLPALPALDKNSTPSMAALLAIFLTRPQEHMPERPGWVPQGIVPRSLLAILIVGAFLTVFTNGDALFYGSTLLPALLPWDALSSILAVLVTLIPFLLGRKLLANAEAQRTLLIALVISAMIYSFLALYEVRMSPQLNNMVYGFFPHAWDQHVRAGGFRPIVFLHHGLWLAIFFSAAILSATALVRLSGAGRGFVFFWAVAWLLLTLILSKALGALALTLLLLPVVGFLGYRHQVMVAAILSGTILVYPMLRSADLVPVERVLEWAESISDERAESLGFRLINEDILLDKALERPWLGWGGWGRNHGYNAEGTVLTVVDGYWVGTIGVGGWVRYIGEFGLLCLSSILLFLYARRYKIGLETSVLAVILAGNVVDLIPNATITPITWMIAGAIWGRLEIGASPEGQNAGDRAGARTGRRKGSLTRTKPATKTAQSSAPDHSRYTRQSRRVRRGDTDKRRDPE